MEISYPTPVRVMGNNVHTLMFWLKAIQTIADYSLVDEWTVKEIASHLRGVTLADY